MSTENTEYSWYWYQRTKGKRWYLGIVNNNGDDPSAAYDIEVYFDKIYDEITSNDDDIPVPLEFEEALIKACVAELLLMDGNSKLEYRIREYRKEYEDGIAQAVHKQINESQQPAVIKPLDLRDDD